MARGSSAVLVAVSHEKVGNARIHNPSRPLREYEFGSTITASGIDSKARRLEGSKARRLEGSKYSQIH